VLFGDGAGAVVLERSTSGGFLGFELGADGGGGEHLWLPGSGSRRFDEPDSILKMNGREVFKFATRVMVSSAEAVLGQCGKTIDDVDVYVPHQANKRIIDYAVGKLGIPPERTVVNVDRFGNTSSGSIPLCTRGRACRGQARRRRTGADDGNGRRAHVGLGADRVGRPAGLGKSNVRAEENDEQDRFLFPWAGRARAGHGP
jgi:3-oxoacyl-[acyl-carrier-protein] synthase-3